MWVGTRGEKLLTSSRLIKRGKPTTVLSVLSKHLHHFSGALSVSTILQYIDVLKYLGWYIECLAEGGGEEESYHRAPYFNKSGTGFRGGISSLQIREIKYAPLQDWGFS